ncbi:BadF/BadG/BcrA/BcrD ATPase family protein [Caulobacter mirabilis]|uniref:BadF/BadG/BcrA/BcrD ATPase family protein n=1 Tax=Caulobacter mirabilis TaxID=69666 RepID=UPI001559B706|nr:BadF/BadG/BcrA/BcrD ATPase family protein [Caulobacter mirabilis]
MSGRLVIGLDSGGAKTAGALCDERGRVLAQARDVGAAIVGLPTPHFYAVAEAALAGLCRDAGVALDRVDRVAIGLSGVDYPDEQAEQHRLVAERLGLGGRLDLVNDGLVALWGVSDTTKTALMQHGSGITTAYRTAPGQETIYDSLDIAQVYDLRRAAFAQTARMIDGRARVTGLRDRVLAHCGVTADRFAEWAFRDPAARARRFAVAGVVFDAWREGDPAARVMVERAAADYVLSMRAMGDRIDGSFDAAFGGGVITRGGRAFQDLIGDLMAWEVPAARMVDIRLPPELGAVVLAGHGCGLDARTLFADLAALETAS